MRFKAFWVVGLAVILGGLGVIHPNQTPVTAADTHDPPVVKPAQPPTPAPKVDAKIDIAPPVLKLEKFKRGSIRSPQHVINAAKKYQSIHATMPQYVNIPTYMSMWGNNQYGNCTGAETMFARVASSNGQLKPTDQEAIAWSQDAGVLDGGIISDVLDYEARKGCVIGGATYKSGPKQSVDYTNQLTLFSAITQGPLKFGVDASVLPSGAGNGSGWMVINAPPSSNYDHCMSVTGCGTMTWLAQQMGVSLPAGYDGTTPGVLVYTWAGIGLMDWISFQNSVCEVWLRTPTTVGFAPPSPAPTPPPPTPTPTPPGPGPNPGPVPAGGFSGTVTYTYAAGVLTGVATTDGSPSSIPGLKAELQSVGISPAIITDVIALVLAVKNKAGVAVIAADAAKVIEDIFLPANAKTLGPVAPQAVKTSIHLQPARREELFAEWLVTA